MFSILQRFSRLCCRFSKAASQSSALNSFTGVTLCTSNECAQHFVCVVTVWTHKPSTVKAMVHLRVVFCALGTSNVSSGFQTLENNKTTRPAASWFQAFSCVLNPKHPQQYFRENRTSSPFPFSRLVFLICITMQSNVDARQFRAKTTNSPNLPRIRARFHCNTNEPAELTVKRAINVITLCFIESIKWHQISRVGL